MSDTPTQETQTAVNPTSEQDDTSITMKNTSGPSMRDVFFGSSGFPQPCLCWGLTCYGFSAAMSVTNQSRPFTTLSMWMAGTYFFINGVNRAQAEKLGENIPRKGWSVRKEYGNNAVAATLWMACSLRQFMIHRRLAYAGLSSWTGFGLTTYYGFRYLLTPDEE